MGKFSGRSSRMPSCSGYGGRGRGQFQGRRSNGLNSGLSGLTEPKFGPQVTGKPQTAMYMKVKEEVVSFV